MKNSININIIISFTFVILVAIFNQCSWIVLFDSDGYLDLWKKMFFFSLNIFFIVTALLFYIKRRNHNFISRYLQLILINSVVLSLVLLILELIFGNWFNPYNINQLNIKKDCVIQYELHGLYPWHNDNIIYSRDKWGFRGIYPSLNSIDILTIGGSTTDQRYISDGYTFQDILKKEFAKNGKDISVVNAGIDGQSTYGHIKNFDYWFSRIPDLNIKYILFYVGINDFYKDSNYHYDSMSIDTVFSVMKEFKTKSVLYYLYRIFEGASLADAYDLNHDVSNNINQFSTNNWVDQPRLSNYEDLMQSRLDAYEQRLNILCNEVKSLGSIPIFVTQSNRRLYDIIDGTLLGDTIIYANYDGHLVNGIDYYYMIQLIHERTRKISERNGGIFLHADKEIKFDIKNDYYDSCHHTPSGSEKVGKYLYIKLKHLF